MGVRVRCRMMDGHVPLRCRFHPPLVAGPRAGRLSTGNPPADHRGRDRQRVQAGFADRDADRVGAGVEFGFGRSDLVVHCSGDCGLLRSSGSTSVNNAGTHRRAYGRGCHRSPDRGQPRRLIAVAQTVG
ncbi:MAG: hypothetical protein JWP34_5130 [Massilia sp.]|nr:hypothetical protein [Massilia sp.]